MKSPATKTRHGMTAIEVLVASTLASLMLGAVAGLLGTLSRQQRELMSREDRPAWQQQLVDQFSTDLQNARRYMVTPDGLWLEGFGGRDSATSRRTGHPTLVHYYLKDVGESRWLLRCEMQTATGKTASHTELVCRGVEGFKWGEALVDVAAPSPTLQPASEQFLTVPDRVHLRIAFHQKYQSNIDRLLCVR